MVHETAKENNMKKNTLIFILSSLIFISGFSFSMAEDNPARKAGLNQKQRIEEGIKSGELTPEEARRLEAEQMKLREIESNVQSDGKVTPREREIVKSKRENASRHIKRLKNNPKDVE